MRFAGLNMSWFLQLLRALQKFFHGYKCISLLSNKHFWVRKHENITAKTALGLKLREFSPANFNNKMIHHVYDLYQCNNKLGYYMLYIKWLDQVILVHSYRG